MKITTRGRAFEIVNGQRVYIIGYIVQRIRSFERRLRLWVSSQIYNDHRECDVENGSKIRNLRPVYARHLPEVDR